MFTICKESGFVDLQRRRFLLLQTSCLATEHNVHEMVDNQDRL